MILWITPTHQDPSSAFKPSSKIIHKIPEPLENASIFYHSFDHGITNYASLQLASHFHLMDLRRVFVVLTVGTLVALIGVANLSVNKSRKKGNHMKTKEDDEQMIQAESQVIYLMVLRYGGQQGSGVSGITSIQCWAGNIGLPIRIVEPVISTTEIVFSLRAESTEFMEFSEYFDLEYFNNASRAAGYAEVVPRKTFLEANSKNVVIIIITRKDRTNDPIINWARNSTHPCYNGSHYLEFKEAGYCIVEATSINLTSLTSTARILLDKWSHLRVTLVVVRWMAPYTTVPECEQKYRATKFQLRPSKRLLNDASRYIEKYIGNAGTTYTAIMLRLEHTAILAEKRPHQYSIQGCLRQVDATFKKIGKGPWSKIPMIAADIGNYGSNSFKWAVRYKARLKEGINLTQSTILKLLNNRLTLQQWEESFVWAAGGVTNGAYIAALQRTIASQAKCLVLMGGGSFQDLALQDYVRLHSVKMQRCIHFVCVDNQRVLKSRL